ncbi:MAG: hypothetical protein E7264_10890 [Lachnospiraceae bacterium]|nr:hypothetical protein [Lachnospiraceae bacterium]
MNYQEFLNYVVENLPNLMNEMEQERHSKEKSEESPVINYAAHLHTITKNNGITLDGVTLLNEGASVGPNIYLNSFYDSYQLGKPIHTIMEEIIECHNRAIEENRFEVVDVCDFQAIKEHIVVRLVNYEKNQSQLETCPHKRYLDFAVTFRYLVNKDTVGLASSLIQNKEFEQWNISIDELYDIALFNTMREFPWHTESLTRVVFDCLAECLPSHNTEEIKEHMEELNQVEEKIPMYVLTNDVGLNGATCLLYDNVIRNFSIVHDSNLYILPSSVHEVILVLETEDTNTDVLQEIVIDANCSAVGLIDLLSDNIYYYDRASDQISICRNVVDKAECIQ